MKALVLTLCVIGTVPFLECAQEKQSTWSKIKGIFSKKDKQQPAEQLVTKESTSTIKRITENKAEIFATIKDLKNALKQFGVYFQNKLTTVSVKVKTLDAVRTEYKKYKKQSEDLNKKLEVAQKKEIELRTERQKFQEKEKETGSLDKKIYTVVEERKKIEKSSKLLFEVYERLAGQIGRLRADFFEALVEVPKKAKMIMVYSKVLFSLTESKKAEELVTNIIAVSDELVRKGSAITDQLLLVYKGYGKHSENEDYIPKEQKIAINDYVKSVVDFTQKAQPVLSKIESILIAINATASLADSVTLGFIKPLKKIWSTLKVVSTVLGHVTDLASDIATVTISEKEASLIEQSNKEIKDIMNVFDKELGLL